LPGDAESGTTARWDPLLYAANAGFVPALGQIVLDWLDPQPGEAVLDLGCGDGVLTQKIVAAGAAVEGIDADAAMVAVARGRGVDARLMDARALEAEARYDAVFSNATLHWIRPPELVVANVARALKPGGRFVAEMGGHGNIAAIRVALAATLATRGFVEPTHMHYFPTPEEQTAVLEGAGLVVEQMLLVPRPTPLPTGMAAWLETFRNGFLDGVGVDESQRAEMIAETVSRLKPVLRDSAGRWTADYVRLRFIARKPE
jgi:SAM-dependent methyltransferase